MNRWKLDQIVKWIDLWINKLVIMNRWMPEQIAK